MPEHAAGKDLFDVWAPNADSVKLLADGREYAMEQNHDGGARGWWRAPAGVPTADNTAYGYLVDGEGPFPDPRSRRQPDGVHGLSATFDADAARWLHWETLASVPLSGWAAVAYLGWAANTVGNVLWTRLLQRYPANQVAPFSLAVPVVGLTAGMMLLDERVAPWQWAGIVLVVAALACVVLGPRLSSRFQAKNASNA